MGEGGVKERESERECGMGRTTFAEEGIFCIERRQSVSHPPWVFHTMDPSMSLDLYKVTRAPDFTHVGMWQLIISASHFMLLIWYWIQWQSAVENVQKGWLLRLLTRVLQLKPDSRGGNFYTICLCMSRVRPFSCWMWDLTNPKPIQLSPKLSFVSKLPSCARMKVNSHAYRVEHCSHSKISEKQTYYSCVLTTHFFQ